MESHTHPPEPVRKKNFTQSISLIVGFLLVVLGLCGLQFPAFAGLHLSVIHSLVTLAAGVLLFWNGYKNYHARDAFYTCLAFGIFFGLHSALGFIMGEPGMPTVGFQRQDPLLFQVIPGLVEFGRNDHILNAVLSVVLFGGAIDWWRRHNQQGTHFRGGQKREHDRRVRHTNRPVHHH